MTESINVARRDGLTILGEGQFGANVPAHGFHVRPTLIGVKRSGDGRERGSRPSIAAKRMIAIKHGG